MGGDGGQERRGEGGEQHWGWCSEEFGDAQGCRADLCLCPGHPLHTSGERFCHQTAFRASLPPRRYFPPLSLVSEPGAGGFPPLLSPWGWGSPSPTHPAIDLPGAFLSTLTHFHFVGDRSSKQQGSGSQRAGVDGGARGASHSQGHTQDLQGLFGVL